MTSARDQLDREFEAFLAEEESRVASLYRKLPRPEPDARLDAAVRSMAHRALNPQLVAAPRSEPRRWRARWLPAFGAAAGIVFAAGIAWRVETARRSESDRLSAPSSDVISVRQLDVPPPPPAEPPVSPAPPPAQATATLQATRTSRKAENAAAPVPAESAKPAAAPVREKVTAKVAEQEEDRPAAAAAGSLSKTQPAAKPAPRAFPVQAQKRASEMDAVERKQIMAAGAWQNLHDRDTGASAKDGARTKTLDDKAPGTAAASPSGSVAGSAVSTPALAQPSARREAPAPGPAVQPEQAPSRADAAEERVRDEPALSSATAGGKIMAAPTRSSDPNAGLYPEHWLANIRTMLKENRRDEAMRSLAEFRKIYPAYRLPDDLRDLK
ncbi:MAG TPA: hypothetical protein VGH81_13825 [Rudaea sp.]|jgi:hypothetical protein